MQKAVSVLVLTYNSVWEKLKATLRSVLKQKDIDFEIIISDDGSEYNELDDLEQFFKENNFSNYKIIINEINKGIVTNAFVATSKSTGEYVRPISPGDLLYNEYVLRDSYNYAKEHKSDILFGNMICYKKEGENFTGFSNLSIPRCPEIYNCEDWYAEVIANIFFKDNISGASLFVKKDVYKHYMEIFKGKVIYIEDMFLKVALLEKKKVNWIDCNVLYYEYSDGGISTTGNPVWTQRMKKDEDVVKSILSETIKEINDNKINKYVAFYDEKNKIKKEIKRLFLPELHKVKHKIYKSKRTSRDDFSMFFYSCWHEG